MLTTRPKPKCRCCRWRNGKLRTPITIHRINERLGTVETEDLWVHPSAPVAHGKLWRTITGIRPKDGGAC